MINNEQCAPDKPDSPGSHPPDSEASPRRGPGAPFGNQNARKRDFYARHAAGSRQPSLEEAMQVQGLEQEIGLLRHKLQLMEIRSPDDLMLFFKGVNILSNVMARCRHLPKKKDENEILRGLQSLFSGIIIPEEAKNEILAKELD
ncbi:MAG: hypothetical protein P3T54_08655 [Dehalogenimonas sp.]|uniref:Uncharacterized protein n=1 Tax=Candidatus Dehalogenimonas loeffleri TaxID=3127115 RepID=A0ABZ2J5C8_9CHLR|nr:hypothetical protein [Dehalogenimonas sp.]